MDTWKKKHLQTLKTYEGYIDELSDDFDGLMFDYKDMLEGCEKKIEKLTINNYLSIA